MVLGQVLLPVAGCFVVASKTLLGATFEDGGIEVLGVQLQHIHQIFPCPADGLLLEIVTERPVAEHLEHGVVVGVVAHLLEVVVLATNAQTLLRVGHTLALGRGIAQNDILELVHTGIGKHQCGVVLHDHRSRGHDEVLLGLKKTLERVSDFVCCQHIIIRINLIFLK